jgi:hypothetical protein
MDGTQLTATHGFNKFSHHWVKRDGSVWLRLVKAGQASDPELEQKLQEKALARKKTGESTERLKDPRKKPLELKTPQRKPPVRATQERRAREVVASHRSELDDLESDAATARLRHLLGDIESDTPEEQLRKRLDRRLTLADTTEVDSDPESNPAPERGAKKSRARPKALGGGLRLKAIPAPGQSASSAKARRPTSSKPDSRQPESNEDSRQTDSEED